MPKVLIANSLSNGFTVFLTENDAWSLNIDEAERTDSEAADAALLARGERDAKANKVVEPYLIEVTLENGRLRPVVYREFIRARGPSVPIPGSNGGN